MSKRICIIDDDEAIVDILGQILRERGYEVLPIIDATTLYPQILSWRPDLIFLDVRLAELDGSAIAMTFKKQQSVKEIPIIMISANTEGATEAKKSGADGFIAKPFELDELFRVIHQFLGAS